MINQIHPNKIKQVLFLAFILLLGFMILRETQMFLSAFLGAVSLYVVSRTWMMKLLTQLKWKRWVAALTIILGCIILLMIPFYWMSTVIVTKLPQKAIDPTLHWLLGYMTPWLSVHTAVLHYL